MTRIFSCACFKKQKSTIKRLAGDFLFLQGSYHCGQCKPGYTGDQTRGCQAERSCRNRALNPCSIHARCIDERRGEVTCIVSSLIHAFLQWNPAFFLGWKWERLCGHFIQSNVLPVVTRWPRPAVKTGLQLFCSCHMSVKQPYSCITFTVSV